VSRRELRRRFDVPVELFCYPAGSYDEESVAAVEEAGYRLAITAEPGLASPKDDPLTLPRIRVQGSDGRDGLARKLIDAGA
jgi:peptidoglycan/xylan/chitin deacetylase (PgdA/CDA1 family)